MNRRGFLGAILAASMAPAIARSGVLMPIYGRPRSATPPARAFWPILFHPGKKEEE